MIFIFFIKFIYFVHASRWLLAANHGICMKIRRIGRKSFSPSTSCVLGIKQRLLDMKEETTTEPSYLPGLMIFFYHYLRNSVFIFVSHGSLCSVSCGDSVDGGIKGTG